MTASPQPAPAATRGDGSRAERPWVVPAAFVYTVGTDKGLNEMPPDYFA